MNECQILIRTTMIIAAFLICLAIQATFAVELELRKCVSCACGSHGKNVTVCVADAAHTEVCARLLNCETCDERLIVCSQCPKGLEGPLCSQEIKKSRQKRQYRRMYPVRRWQIGRKSAPLRMASSCVNLDGPKLGSIRCTSSIDEQTCTGQCLPGYRFTDGTLGDMTLTCEGGVWTPRTEFPDCISGGHCELVVQGSGSFNCTTGMDGTQCDVRCYNRYVGRFFCYPGRAWEPPLPRCVRRKDMIEDRYACECRNGGTCDSNGNCVCPASRTGIDCETALPEKAICKDPGFISNGYRRNMDGSDATLRRNFEEGQSVVYGCVSEAYALKGSSLLRCTSDGTWSDSLPTCIAPATAAPGRTCPDPGQVANAERLNSDGSPSVDIQQYKAGQSVVYTCRPGFALQRRSLLTCLPSGAWSFRTPYCRRVVGVDPKKPDTVAPTSSGLRFCRDPGVDPNGNRQPRTPPSRRGFPQGTQLEYSCNRNFELSGERSLFCLTSGDWSASRPRCREQRVVVPENYCTDLGTIFNGKVQALLPIDPRLSEPTAPDYPEGTRLRYSCDSGYLLEGQDTLICEQDGFWSDVKPSCKLDADRHQYCLPPGAIENGVVVHVPSLNERRRPSNRDDEGEELYPAQSQLQYSCDDGYNLEGAVILTCKDTGRWSAESPKCVKINPEEMHYCDSPEPILNGRLRYYPPAVRPRRGHKPSNLDYDTDQYPEGAVVEYSCEEGYRLQGERSLTCLRTGFWSEMVPTCVSDCGLSFIEASNRVFMGERANSGEWPWVVSISAVYSNTSRFICGGAVLDTQTVITAGHCLVNGAEGYILRFGKHHFKIQDDDADVLIRRSSRVIIHPDYKQTNSTLDSDIGLITFQPKIRYSTRVQPVCLPTRQSTFRNIMTGRTGYVSGWGETENNAPPEVMMMTSLPVVNPETCVDVFKQQNMVINGNMFCAGYEDSRQTVCSGDSGSPLVFYDSSTERYTIEGLVSFGIRGQCGSSGKYAIFTKVFRFTPWIYRHTQRIN